MIFRVMFMYNGLGFSALGVGVHKKLKAEEIQVPGSLLSQVSVPLCIVRTECRPLTSLVEKPRMDRTDSKAPGPQMVPCHSH